MEAVLVVLGEHLMTTAPGREVTAVDLLAGSTLPPAQPAGLAASSASRTRSIMPGPAGLKVPRESRLPVNARAAASATSR